MKETGHLAGGSGKDHAKPQPEYLVCRLISESLITSIQSTVLTKLEDSPNTVLYTKQWQSVKSDVHLSHSLDNNDSNFS